MHESDYQSDLSTESPQQAHQDTPDFAALLKMPLIISVEKLACLYLRTGAWVGLPTSVEESEIFFRRHESRRAAGLFLDGLPGSEATTML